MKKVVFVVLATLIAVSAMAGVYSERAVSAMTYITDPVNGLYNPAEGLPWVDGDPTNPSAPILDNQDPSYLGSYFYSTAALIAGMHATDVNTGYARNAMERVFIANFNAGTALPNEPWWDDTDSMLMFDAHIPWRLDPTMSPPADVSDVYLERVLWSAYFLTLAGEVEYTPFIAKILRGIRNNPTFFNETTAAIKYDGTDNLYLTALWGLVLESYMRSWELYPMRVSVIDPPILDYDWSVEARGAWLFVEAMMDYYFGVTLPDWWARYNFSSDFCPLGGIPEGEPCGDDNNGGCNDPGGGYPIEVVEPNTIICGTVWAQPIEGVSTRDTDWYQVTLTEPGNVTLRADSEAPTNIFHLGIDFSPCNASALNTMTVGPSSPGTMDLGVLPAGTHYFWAGLTVFDGYPCDVNYWLEVEVSEPPLMAYSFSGATHAEAPVGDYYLGSRMPGSSMPSSSFASIRAPMSAARGLERWEYLPIMMFAAISGNTIIAEDLWDDHIDDVAWTVWRGDVRDYFRDGPIWDGDRSVYSPLGRFPGVMSFYDLANLELYRATLEPRYSERLIEIEDDFWGVNLWDGDYYIQSTPRNPNVIWNGLHAFALAHIPTVKIDSIWSDLPSEGEAPWDYNANINQNHNVTIRVTNTGLVPVEHIQLIVFEDFGGIRFDFVPVPRIEPGEFADVVHNIGGPANPSDHWIICWFESEDHFEDETTIGSWLRINVQEPSDVDIVFLGGSPETSPRHPFLTTGQEFLFEVRVQNIGGAAIDELEVTLSQSSPYGLEFEFPDGMTYLGQAFIDATPLPEDTLGKILEGEIGRIFFRAIAPMGVGDILLDDINVEANIVRIKDDNVRAFVTSGLPSDDVWFDIQHRANLTVTRIEMTTGWLNADDPEDIIIHIENEEGDVATADRIDIIDAIYGHSLELFASTVTGIRGLDEPAFAPAEIPAGASDFIMFTLQNDVASENAIVDINYQGRYHDGNRGDELFREIGHYFSHPYIGDFTAGDNINRHIPLPMQEANRTAAQFVIERSEIASYGGRIDSLKFFTWDTIGTVETVRFFIENVDFDELTAASVNPVAPFFVCTLVVNRDSTVTVCIPDGFMYDGRNILITMRKMSFDNPEVRWRGTNVDEIVARYNDVSAAFPLPSTSRFKPNVEFYVTGFGVDVVAPLALPLVPVAGGPWPDDDTVWVRATDNLSGVDKVEMYIQNIDGTHFWNFFPPGSWQLADFKVPMFHKPGTDLWFRELRFPPPGDFIIYIDCVDKAGNQMPTDYVPMTDDLLILNLTQTKTNLWRGSPAAPVAPGARWNYECDYEFEYRCSVLVYNTGDNVANDVVVELRSVSSRTGINPLTVTHNIPNGDSRWFVFEITAPDFSFVDSLWARIIGGTHSGGKPVAEGIVSGGNYTRVLVEQPADFVIDTVWVNPDDIVNWHEEEGDTALVTMGQVFRVHAKVRNDGKDPIDSVHVFLDQTPGWESIISPEDPIVIHNILMGEERVVEFEVIADTLNSGLCPVQWDHYLILDFVEASFTAHNHAPGYITDLITIEDDRAPIGIQEHPSLIVEGWLVDEVFAPAETTWINMTNTVNFDVWLFNEFAECLAGGGPPDDDRAPADRVDHSDDYPSVLELWWFNWLAEDDELDDPPFDPLTDEFIQERRDNNIVRLEVETLTSEVIKPGERDTLSWLLSWNGEYDGVHEGVWWPAHYNVYGDNNNQVDLFVYDTLFDTLSLYPLIIDSVEIVTPRYWLWEHFDRCIGIDVTRPICEIVRPTLPYYRHFPDTMIIHTSDSISGIRNGSIKVQFEAPSGETYNGTNWTMGDHWFTAYQDIIFGPDTFWFDVPPPTEEGCWTFRAYGYDIADNKSIIDEVDFIWDKTPPQSEILYPEPGYYSYSATNVWDREIRIWAQDDLTAGFDCVAHVRDVYVAIYDEIGNVWWTGTHWETSAVRHWLTCSPTDEDDIWEYTDFTADNSARLKIFSWVCDNADNYAPTLDSIFYVRVDQDAPTSVLTDKFRVELDDISLVGVDIVWPVDMTDRIWGEATDFFTRVDSVRYSVWDSLNDLYWNGASFVESDEEIWNEPALYNYDGLGWFPPDVVPYPHAPGIEEGTGQVLQWQSGLFTQPDFGYYRVRSKAFDDLGHVEEVFTEHNEKVLLFDNCPPTIEPRYPDAGAVYYIWDWVDSFVVYAYDECGFGPGGVHGGPVDDVKFWIMNPRGQYWGWMPVLGWRWHDWAVELPGVQINDSLWRPNNIPMLTEEGHYTMVVRAWDQNGNLRLNAWSWTLTVSGEFLTVEALPNDPGRDWFFVDEEFTLRVIAWSHPGVVDESFSHQFFFGDNMPLPENLEILTPEPYWAFRGTLDVVAKCDVPVLGLEVFVDAPTSGLPRASTAPIDIIQLIDDDLGGFVMDNPDDQGNFMWLHHNRTTQDPLYGDVDIDTMSVKIQAYHYFRDEDTDPLTSDWQPIAILDEASDGDSVRLLFDNDNEFTEYEYSMIVDLVIQGLGTIVQTDRIMLGSGRPIDNIPPQKVENLNISYVGGVTLLEWDMVTHGADDPPTPEINPHENIYYEIYRFTSPTEALDSGLEPTWVTGLGETEFIVPDVLDATQPYYYAVRARDFDDNVSPEFSNRVGKVDYEVAPGFSWLGYPLPVPGLVDPNDYIARLGIPLADLYSFNNAIGGWEELLVGGFGRDLFDDGTDNIFALSAWTGTARWTGYVPEPAEELNIAFELFPGFNGIILPLVRDDLTMASDLYFELEALGYEPVFVSRRVPGGAWQSIHVDGEGTVYLDFPIYPGHPYMVGIDGAGVWPVYPDRMPSLRKRSIDAKKVSVVPMPNTCFIPFFAEDNSRIDRVSVTATWGEQVRTGDVDDHIIRVELSDFVGIKPGEQVRLEVVGDDGLFVGERLITVGEDGVHLEPEMVLAKTTPTLPEHFALHGNVPNPFNPATSISFDLPERADVDLTIYNIEGRLVRRMVSNEMPAGYHNVVWDGRDESGTIAPAGVYFYQLRAGEFSARRRMMLVK